MLTSISYLYLFDKPLIFWLGIINLLLLLLTASIGFLNKKGYHKIPMKTHYLFAKITLIGVLIHGLINRLIYI